MSYRDGHAEIYVMNDDGSDITKLTDPPGSNDGAGWSPDCTKIAFQSTRDGNYEVYVMNADGTDQENLTKNSANDSNPSWSPFLPAGETLTNVTSMSQIDKFNTRFDRSTGQFSMMVTWKNIGASTFYQPLQMVIENITPPTVTVANADGTTPEGKSY